MKALVWSVIGIAILVGCLVAHQVSAQETDALRESKAPAPNASGIKLSVRIHDNPNDQYLLYLRQLGLTHVDVVITSNLGYDRARLAEVVGHLKDEGFQVGCVNNYAFWALKSDPILLGQPEREALMEEYLQFLRDAAAVGFTSELISWNPSQVGYADGWRADTCRGAITAHVAYNSEKEQPLAYDREYTEEEMWDNFAWWAERAMPVAEEVGISLGFHPQFGIPEAMGVPSLFSSRAGFEHAIEIADSPRMGLALCTGTWASNPELFGDAVDAVRHFGKQKRIFHLHLRNISGPLPKFHETFPDNGYLDMHEIMRALYEVGFEGTVIPDHAPVLVNDETMPYGGVGIGPGGGRAYSIAYLRGILMALEKGWGPQGPSSSK